MSEDNPATIHIPADLLRSLCDRAEECASALQQENERRDVPEALDLINLVHQVDAILGAAEETVLHSKLVNAALDGAEQVFPRLGEVRREVEGDFRAGYAAGQRDERERLAREVVDTYGQWTYWGEHGDAIAAASAAREIAAAVRLGRPLTTAEIEALE